MQIGYTAASMLDDLNFFLKYSGNVLALREEIVKQILSLRDILNSPSSDTNVVYVQGCHDGLVTVVEALDINYEQAIQKPSQQINFQIEPIPQKQQ